jgi:hypothetical protein
LHHQQNCKVEAAQAPTYMHVPGWIIWIIENIVIFGVKCLTDPVLENASVFGKTGALRSYQAMKRMKHVKSE